jgi:hypothetical protein
VAQEDSSSKDVDTESTAANVMMAPTPTLVPSAGEPAEVSNETLRREMMNGWNFNDMAEILPGICSL